VHTGLGCTYVLRYSRFPNMLLSNPWAAGPELLVDATRNLWNVELRKIVLRDALAALSSKWKSPVLRSSPSSFGPRRPPLIPFRDCSKMRDDHAHDDEKDGIYRFIYWFGSH
jgi:hypothetical protein